jgi:hypothetical protein
MTTEIKRIIAMNLRELGKHYNLSQEPKQPELVTRSGNSSWFIEPMQIIIGLDQEDLMSPAAHETSHYLRHLQNLQPWNLKNFRQQKAEEVLAELHTITFIDSKDLLRQVLKCQERERNALTEESEIRYYASYMARQKKALEIYQKDKNALETLANLNSEELIRRTC